MRKYSLPQGKPLPADLQQKFAAALEALVEQVKQDRSVLAAILCGSLSHDTVWKKSDIDLVLVTIDDKRPIVRTLRSTPMASTCTR